MNQEQRLLSRRTLWNVPWEDAEWMDVPASDYGPQSLVETCGWAGCSY